MRMFGLTGGIGMGKTTAGLILARLGCRILDTDSIARELTEPGQPALSEIREAFGDEVFSPDGQLRRDLLARRVFADPADLSRLEAILHPRIRHVWVGQMNEWRSQSVSCAAVIIPLLFETDAAREVDSTICIACSEEMQQRRLAERGWTTRQIAERVQAQMTVRRKMELADYVVWNCAGLDLLEVQLARILGLKLEDRADRANPTMA
jgi:dephospho-CoA kinase